MSDNKVKIKSGSVGVSANVKAYFAGLVYDSEAPEIDAPFETIVDAFRFAFALGYSRKITKKPTGKNSTANIAPRSFVVDKYSIILEDGICEDFNSLGALASAYAEAGAELMMKTQAEGKSILSLLD